MNFVLEILRYTIPSAILLIGVYFIISKFFEQNEILNRIELKKLSIKENSKISLPLRLQAYERAILFLERIHPYHLVQRVRETNMNVSDFNLLINKTIRTEFEYNLSQQIYLSKDAWTMLERAKEETQKQINAIASKLPNDANSIELSKAVYEYFVETEQDFPVQIAINFIKEDVKKLF